MAANIRAWSPEDSVAELTDLLHAAYAPLAARGLNLVGLTQTDEMTARRIARGECMVAADSGHIVGTLLFVRRSQDTEWYRRPDVGVVFQLAVHPDYQHQGIGSRLIAAVERRARATGCTELALDTADSASHLIAWYGRHGFRRVGRLQWPGRGHRSVILSKRLAGGRRG
ncbi:MAG: GNAT family N-acetyltransferase [Alphaproteobacteria bacterium]|nr:GNAT family N-acetyltransferase [Alphaproteobacteria bacterium]